MILGILFLSLSISFFSCKKALDQLPLDQFSSSNFWTSESNALLALTAVYQGDRSGQPVDWWSAWAGLLDIEEASDNAYDRRGDNAPFNKLSNGTLTSSLNILENYWSGSYKRIAKCNNFLENIGKITMNETHRTRFIAEARFIRACQYFYLSQYFGSVPIVTKNLSPDEANNVKKSFKADVEKFVEEELIAASQNLPLYKDIPGAEFGRASKQGALAFLGRLYLGEERWKEAATTYKQIIDWGDNIIDPDYPSLFDGTNESSKEIIFSAQFIANLEGNGMLQFYFPAVVGGFARYCPLASLVESYDFKDGTSFSYDSPQYNPNNIGKNRDPRLNYTILYNGEKFNGLNFITHPDSSSAPDQLGAGKQSSHTGYGFKKFCPEGYSGDFGTSGIDLPIIRYAEILLSYLEAKIEAGATIDQPLLDMSINLIRNRSSVNMPAITITDPINLLPIVRHERRVELACEGIRYWDLLRWHIADSVLNGVFYGASFPGAIRINKAPDGHIDPYSRWYVTSKYFRADIDYQWPIPQSEVNINPNLK